MTEQEDGQCGGVLNGAEKGIVDYNHKDETWKAERLVLHNQMQEGRKSWRGTAKQHVKKS